MPATERVDVLLVEDSPQDATQIERLLTEVGGRDRLLAVDEFTRVDRLEAAFAALDASPDAVLLDLTLPDSDGLETVEAVVERAPDVPIVVITGRRSDVGPESIQRGAQDYLRKGHLTGEMLHRALRYAIDRHRQQRELVDLNRQLTRLNRIVRQDIRDDVSVVVGLGDELREHVDDEATVEALLAAARHAVDCTDQAEALLRTLSTEREAVGTVDADALVAEQVASARDRFAAEVTLDRSDDVATVEATPALGAAVEQLLSNAVRHSDRDRPAVHVTVEPGPETVSITVADDGPGLPDQQRDLLDDPETRYEPRAGIGTGLYLVCAVVERFGGTVAFGENQPRGAAVTVRCPRHR